MPVNLLRVSFYPCPFIQGSGYWSLLRLSGSFCPDRSLGLPSAGFHLRCAYPLRFGTNLRHGAMHLACRVLTAFRLFGVSPSVFGDSHARHFPACHSFTLRRFRTTGAHSHLRRPAEVVSSLAGYIRTTPLGSGLSHLCGYREIWRGSFTSCPGHAFCTRKLDGNLLFQSL